MQCVRFLKAAASSSSPTMSLCGLWDNFTKEKPNTSKYSYADGKDESPSLFLKL